MLYLLVSIYIKDNQKVKGLSDSLSVCEAAFTLDTRYYKFHYCWLELRSDQEGSYIDWCMPKQQAWTQLWLLDLVCWNLEFCTPQMTLNKDISRDLEQRTLVTVFKGNNIHSLNFKQVSTLDLWWPQMTFDLHEKQHHHLLTKCYLYTKFEV